MADQRLIRLWRDIESGHGAEHTSIVVPSLSFDTEELSKIAGVSHYEERLLFCLMRLRDPRARVIYITSQPLHPAIVDYYLGLLDGVSPRSSLARLHLFCCYDGSARALTEKLLERPRLIERVRRELGDPAKAYLTCFNSTSLEEALAERLGVPLNGCDPDLLDLGSKSGSREIFRAADVPLPAGHERVRSEADVLDALEEIWRPGLKRAVIKLDHSFAGAGNALFAFPATRSDSPVARRRSLAAALPDLRLMGSEPVGSFLAKLQSMGGVVEEMLDAEDVRSPSVQLRLTPTAELEVVSTHDQILAGSTGQSYAGCRFPADQAYRRKIQDCAVAIGEQLRDRGVVSRFAVDFVVTRDASGAWSPWAIEINLRMGGTTVPFLALQFLTAGSLDADSGHFQSSDGVRKSYRATDNLASPSYRGLLPEDLMEILALSGLGFSPDSKTGVLFHMVGALSEHGKVGVTAIGDSPEEAESLFQGVVDLLDQETAVDISGERPSVPRLRLPME